MKNQKSIWVKYAGAENVTQTAAINIAKTDYRCTETTVNKVIQNWQTVYFT